jgi:DNA-binding GntR family transcriptional regulator
LYEITEAGREAKAADTITSEQLDLLEESIILANQYYQRGELEKTVEKNSLFHDTILQASQSPLLLQLMDQIKVQIVRFRKMTSVYGFRPSFVEEHEEIYQALVKRDGEKAEILMKVHVEKDLETILERLRENQLLK